MNTKEIEALKIYLKERIEYLESVIKTDNPPDILFYEANASIYELKKLVHLIK